ncbi:glycosyltransferase family 4 protein [Neptunicoccus sediminis]|uniref:glycosyltransferase family 4 protein n=1 Tax=Neptunicoccus sediminis TaxID=1892596 RepID=UPI0008461DD9|nr:glycosyltransferase family 4 protein [Neptunicoccus sediminis]
MRELFVTNFNPNFTGVSATAAGVVGVQQEQFDLALVGEPLPGCPAPISRKAAIAASKTPPKDRPFAIWHVRRNPEMRVAVWARDVLRRPIRIVFTSAAQRFHSAYPRWLINRMDAVIATTPEAAKFVPHVRAVVPHGVDTERFSPGSDRGTDWAALGFGGGFGMATVGRVRPEKGTDLFVEAMIRILPDHPDGVALVVGRAAREHRGFAQDLKKRAAAAGLSDRILFVGELPPEKLPALMRGISLLVALPRYEGYGMTPLEAMASGAPFVASDTGYYRSFSGEGAAGRVVGQEDVDGAVFEINRLLSSQDTLSSMSRTAVSRAREFHSIQGEADGIAQVYEALWQNG